MLNEKGGVVNSLSPKEAVLASSPTELRRYPFGPPFQCSILGSLLWNEAIILFFFFFRHVGEFYIKILTFYLRRLAALD